MLWSRLFLASSTLTSKVIDRLILPFNTMTTFFFRRSIEKAFQLDEQPSGLSLNPNKPFTSNPPYISSAVDDIMYIVNKVLQQSLATSQRDVVSSVVPTLSRVMGSDFIGMIQRKMKDESYPKAAMHGALPPEHTIVAFLVLVNDLEIAVDYVKQIVRPQVAISVSEGQTPNPLTKFFPVHEDLEAVRNVMKSLEVSFETKAVELLNDGLHVVFNNVMKPRLRPILLDAFRDVDYQMTREELSQLAQEEGHEEDDEGGMVRRRFQHGWDALTKPIGRIMTETTFDRLLSIIISYLSKLLEKRIWTYHGRINEFGAVRLERDMNNIASVIVHGKKYVYRDAFLKCSQICMVMNMEEDEWEELQGAVGADGESEVADRLDSDERTRARAMIREITD